MSSLGPWDDVSVGGDQSKTEQIWQALRSAVGKGGSGPEESLEDSWRIAKAQTIAAVCSMAERAVLQAFPDAATDHLAHWERKYGIVPASLVEQDRRDSVVARYRQRPRADGPSIGEAIAELGDFVIEHMPQDHTATVAAGFPQAGNVYNFSDSFVLRIKTSETNIDVDTSELKRYLNRVLPSWVDWRVVNSVGFYCDGFNNSVTDLTEVA